MIANLRTVAITNAKYAAVQFVHRLRISRILFAVIAFIALAVSAPTLVAQVGTGDILGTVTDSTGAVVVGAKVTLKNLGTAEVRTGVTDNKGEYTFNGMPNGSYTLRVESKGFKIFAIANILLSTGDRARYDASLATGAASETVEVTASTASMQVESSEVTSTVNEKAVVDLPLNGRSLESALQVQPGIMYAQNGNTANDRRQSFDIAAANGGTNNEMVDSFDNNERNLGLDGIRPSVDSVQEVKIDTSSYSAEFGRASGAVVNIITKSGTNNFHGSLYEFVRNDVFDAYNWGTAPGAKKPELRQNYYGGSVGGPVWLPKLYNGRNKTFFFVDWEQFRQISGLSPEAIEVPTAYEENELATNGDLDLSDIADLPISGTNSTPLNNFPGQYILPAADVDPLTKNYFLSYPKPNLPCTAIYASGCANYVSTPPGKQNITNLDVRIDEHMGSKNLLFGRVEYEPTSTIYPEEFPAITPATVSAGIYSSAANSLEGIDPGGSGGSASGFAGPAISNTYGIQTDFVHIFNQNLLLDLRAGFTRINIQSQPFDFNNGAAQKMGWPASINTSGVLPSIGGPWAAWTSLIGSSPTEPVIDINNIFQYAGSVTYTHGSHDLKFGAALIRRQIQAFEDSIAGGLIFSGGNDGSGPPFLGAMTYMDDRMNYLNGNFAMILRQDDSFEPNFRVWEPSVYALDNWRVNGKLTLNLGLRYDIYSPFQEAHGNYANFLPSCLNASATTALADGLSCFLTGKQNPTIGVKTDYSDIQPRVGFAYSWDAKTVLRGAFGMTYFTPDEGEVSIGTASPESVMQNYNPQSSFNNQTILPNFNGPAGFCSVATGGGSHGCIETGLPQPEPMSTASVDAFASNSSISSVSAKSTSFRNGYAEMANLAVQRQIGANTVTLAYVGSFGRHLLRLANLDEGKAPGNAWVVANTSPANYAAGNYAQVPYVYGTELPNVTIIGYLDNGSMSAYHSMQAIYNRRFTRGLDFNANFTWGHPLSNGGAQGVTTTGYTFIPTEPSSVEYGGRPSERVAGNIAYTLPFGNNLRGVEGMLIKGWKFNGIGFWQNGSSTTVFAGSMLEVSGVQNDRPDQVKSPKLSHPTISEWFDTTAFKQQLPGNYGTERANQLLGPSARNIDLSINKDFHIFKESAFEFRAECFNAGNFVNYSNPGVTFASTSTFGVITSAANNPRVFQFAGKLKF
jgi:hypothetical protein